MSFAPILDAPVNRDVQHKLKPVRAAGFALRHLAATDRQLLGTLKLVDSARGTGPADESSELRSHCAEVVHLVAEATGVSAEEIETSLISQLHQVVAFANLDGGELDERNVGAVAGLIRSGRVELFAG